MPGNILVRDSGGALYIPQDSTFLPGLHPKHRHTKPLLHLQVHALDTVRWSLPPDCLLATITCLPQQRVQLTSTSPLPPPPTLSSTPGDSPPTIHPALQALPPLDWAVLDYFFPDDGQTVAEGIISGSATAVSDRSFKSQFGTSGFVIRGDNRRLGAIWVNAVPGLPDEHSLYTSKLVGISGSLAIIYAVDTPFSKVLSH
jgi:hypothetical protein